MAKILFMTNKLYGGGQERVTANIVNELANGNDEIILITEKKTDNDYILSKKVRRECMLTNHLLSDLKNVGTFLEKENIDVAVSMGLITNFVLAIINIRHLKTKIIISERNDPRSDNISWKSKLLRFLVYRFTDGMVFQTAEAKSFYSKKLQQNSWIIPNPVTSNLPYRKENTNSTIVTIGRLAKQKNHKNLIDAMKKVKTEHPDYELHIYGVGELEDKLKQYVVTKDMADYVKFMGYASNVHELIKADDVFVLSSDFEGMPNTLMEAMAMGFPVISTDCPCGGPRELIKDGHNGLLVPVNDSTAMAEAIESLLKDNEFKNKIGNNAKMIRDDYSIVAITEKWKDAINTILKGM